MLWTLIIFALTTPMTGTKAAPSTAITSVPGFQDKALCDAAGQAMVGLGGIEDGNAVIGGTKVKTVCVQTRRE